MPTLLGLIGLATAAIPLVLSILALVSQRAKVTTGPLDTQSLRVLKIIRHPLDNGIWENIRRKHRFQAVLILVVIVLASFFVLLVAITVTSLTVSPTLEGGGYNIQGLIVLIEFGLILLSLLLALILFSIYYRNSYLIRCREAEQARYFVFADAEMVVEAEYPYLFDKCHKALRSMRTQVIEVNYDAQFLEAYRPNSPFRHLGLIYVQLEAVKGEEKSFQIHIKVTPYNQDTNVGKNGDYPEERSNVVNQFINFVISQPESMDEKSEKEKKTA